MTATLLLIFASVFLGTFSLYFAFNVLKHYYELRRRVRQIADDPAAGSSAITQLLRETGSTERLFNTLPLTRRLTRQIEHAGLTIFPPLFLLLTCSFSLLGGVVVLAIQRNIFSALLVSLFLLSVPFAYLRQRAAKRASLLDEQLPEALTMIARSLRAGHTLASAVELVGQELSDPAGGLFKLAYDQQKLGMRMADSLRSLTAKVDSIDYNFFVTIVRINSESGGSLAEILEKLAQTIRSRQQIRRQVQVYTAEGSLSGYILIAMPVLMFCLFYVLRPGYMDVFFTQPLCQRILGVAVVAQIAGFFMIRKIIDIRI